MSEPKSTHTIARERVDELAVKNSEPEWLKEERLTAWEAYFKTPMPSGREESWRRTEIDALDLSRLSTIDFNRDLKVEPKLPRQVQRFIKKQGEDACYLVSSNSHVYRSPAAEKLASQGVVLTTIQEALEKHPDLIKPYLVERAAGAEDGCEIDKFSLMNRSLFNCGVFFYVPDNVSIEAPITSILSIEQTESFAVFPRIIVAVGKHSRVSFVKALVSDASSNKGERSGLSLVDALVEVFVGQGAHLSYVEVEDFHTDVFGVIRVVNRVKRDGKLDSLTVGFGGAQLKSDIHTSLLEAGASSNIYGVVLGAGNEHFSYNTIQEHIAPDTSSTINFRVALKGNATSVYLGTIKVAKEAQRTDSYQSNKNLLLGSEARADSIPKLEILADDVKCSHGATVGPADREQIFYLMSRGLTALEAEELVVTGFFRQVSESTSIPGVSEWINELVGDKVHEEPLPQKSPVEAMKGTRKRLKEQGARQ